MSTLASCQKLPTTVPDLANRPRQLVFLTNSQLNDFLNEVHQMARLEPSIVERIDEDLDVARGVWGAKCGAPHFAPLLLGVLVNPFRLSVIEAREAH